MTDKYRPQFSEAVTREMRHRLTHATTGFKVRDSLVRSEFSGVHLGNGRFVSVHHGIANMTHHEKLYAYIKHKNRFPYEYPVEIKQTFPQLDIAYLQIPNFRNRLPSVSIEKKLDIKEGQQLIYVPYFPERKPSPCFVYYDKVLPEEQDPENLQRFPGLKDNLFAVIFPQSIYLNNRFAPPIDGNSGGGVYNELGNLVGLVHLRGYFEGDTGNIFETAYIISSKVL